MEYDVPKDGDARSAANFNFECDLTFIVTPKKMKK